MPTQDTRIYTRTGDDGTTSLFNGERTSKSSARIHVIGDIDELNCVIGLAIASSEQSDINEMLSQLQHALFNIGSNLAAKGKPLVPMPDVAEIESMIDDLSKSIPPLKRFILPGGHLSSAYCHLARAVCRRAERHLVELQVQEADIQESVIFVNRLSDLLFVMARSLNLRHSDSEQYWEKSRW